MISQPLFEDEALPSGVSARLVRHSWIRNSGFALPAEDEARIRRLRVAGAREDLRLSLIARRIAIAELAGCEATNVRFGHSGEGAPQLEHPQGWSVSISGVEGVTAIALAPAGIRVGLDLSLMRDISWQPMLNMVSDGVELSHFVDTYGHDADKSCHAFHRLWTIKEAVLKATGKGMRAGAKNVPVKMSWLSGTASCFNLTAFGVAYRCAALEQDGIAACLVVSASA